MQREARGVLEFLFAQSLSVAQVLDRIRDDPTLSTPVREACFMQAGPFWRELVVHEAERRVYDLYDQALFRADVLQRLRVDTTLREPVREHAGAGGVDAERRGD